MHTKFISGVKPKAKSMSFDQTEENEKYFRGQKKHLCFFRTFLKTLMDTDSNTY